MNTTQTIDLGALVTVRSKTGNWQGNGAVVGFDHEHQFVCVQMFDGLSRLRFVEVDEDRLTLGWQKR